MIIAGGPSNGGRYMSLVLISSLGRHILYYSARHVAIIVLPLSLGDYCLAYSLQHFEFLCLTGLSYCNSYNCDVTFLRLRAYVVTL